MVDQSRSWCSESCKLHMQGRGLYKQGVADLLSHSGCIARGGGGRETILVKAKHLEHLYAKKKKKKLCRCLMYLELSREGFASRKVYYYYYKLPI